MHSTWVGLTLTCIRIRSSKVTTWKSLKCVRCPRGLGLTQWKRSSRQFTALSGHHWEQQKSNTFRGAFLPAPQVEKHTKKVQSPDEATQGPGTTYQGTHRRYKYRDPVRSPGVAKVGHPGWNGPNGTENVPSDWTRPSRGSSQTSIKYLFSLATWRRQVLERDWRDAETVE